MTPDERIRHLESENRQLNEHLSAVQTRCTALLCELRAERAQLKTEREHWRRATDAILLALGTPTARR